METSFTEEAYRKHVEDDRKSVKGKREEQRPENLKPFLTGAAEQTKHISANFKNNCFFIGDHVSPEGRAALPDAREDGVTPHRILFKDGSEMGKC